MAISVGLFQYPVIQFSVNYALSLAYIAFLVHSKSLFEDGRRRFTEVFTEFMIMFATAFLQQLLRPDYDENAKSLLQYMFFTSIALTVLINFAFLALTLREL